MGIREDIEILDSKVARLKIEYEQYFLKVIKKEPYKLREEVDRLVLFYSNQNINNTALKFRFSSIVAKYSSYKQYWTRVLRAIEEGTYNRKAEGTEAFAAVPKQAANTPQEPQRPAQAPPKNDMMDVYNRYIEARKACNEPTEGITPEMLAKTIEQHKKKIEEQYKTADLEVKVYVKDNKARLTIAPRKR